MLDLKQFLPYQLAVVSTEVSQALARRYGARFGLTIPEWRLMAILGQFQPITAKDVCRIGRMHKTTVSRALGGLEGRAFIDRRVNPDDQREAQLALNADGMAAYGEIVPLVEALVEEIRADLTEEEQRVLGELLGRLSQRSSALLAA